MDVKTCKQCGELKPLSQFRRYYGGRKGTYTMCKQCERINSREKYLQSKGELRTVDEERELEKICQLYEYQRSLGLQPPTSTGRRTTVGEELDGMLDKYKDLAMRAGGTTGPTVGQDVSNVPYELLSWLTCDLDKEPDYYLDEVYEKLRDTYRPCIGIDKANMMPMYDNKYKAILDRILERFNAYEDTYYEGTE